jgi:hypothetical protein
LDESQPKEKAMRENVIRDIVTRIMTDDEFRQGVLERPGIALKEYNIDNEELTALVTQMGGVGVVMFEPRISASLTAPTLGAGDGGCKCGCTANGWKKDYCAKMGC